LSVWGYQAVEEDNRIPSSIKDVQGGSGVTWSGRELTTKMGEQPWPQLVRCASICCCVCGYVFQKDRIVVRSSEEEWYILIGVEMDIKDINDFNL